MCSLIGLRNMTYPAGGISTLFNRQDLQLLVLSRFVRVAVGLGKKKARRMPGFIDLNSVLKKQVQRKR